MPKGRTSRCRTPLVLAFTLLLALAANVAQPVDVRIYERTTAHGVELLDDPEVKPDIRDWLTANLALASGE